MDCIINNNVFPGTSLQDIGSIDSATAAEIGDGGSERRQEAN